MVGPHRRSPWAPGQRRRARTPVTTVAYAPRDLPASPPPLSGLRRAQLTDTYLTLLERHVWEPAPRAPAGACRLHRVLYLLRLRLGR